MADLEKNLTLVLSKKTNKKSNKEKIFMRISNCLTNINVTYNAFAEAYKCNNIYSLFKISHSFYTNSIEFIHLSEDMYKNKLIEDTEDNSKIIIENMDILKVYVGALKLERDLWISKSTLFEDPHFSHTIIEGNKKFRELENKIEHFFMMAPQEKNTKFTQHF